MGEITIEPKITEKVTKETVIVIPVVVPDEQPTTTSEPEVPATTPEEVPVPTEATAA